MPSTVLLSPPSPATRATPSATTLGELREHRAQLSHLVDRFHASSLSGFDAARAVEVACEVEHLAGALKVLAASRVIETGSWADRGATSAPRWLAQSAKSTVGDAARTLDTAKKLEQLPATRQRVRQGRLSAAQAREVADAAVADPSAEAGLLAMAERSSVAELRARCRAVKAAATPESADERYDKVRRGRRLTHWLDDEGGFNLGGRSTVDDGALINAILDPIADRLFRQAHQTGRRESTQAYRWDALVEVFRLAGLFETNPELWDLVDQADTDDREGGDAAATDDDVIDLRERAPRAPSAHGSLFDRDVTEPAAPAQASTPLRAPPASDQRRTRGQPRGRPKPKRKRRSPTATVGSRAKVIVRIDHAALVRGWVEGEEICDIAGIGPIPVRIAKAMMRDAFLAAIVTHGTDVHTVAHLGRRANAVQTTALDFTDTSCSTEGCPNTARLETDHTQEWHRTRHTTLTELGRPCGPCHTLRTHHGYRYGPVNPATGKRPLHPPSSPPGTA
jgi:hypothetical protein